MPPTRRLWAFIGIGLVVGFMSGLFGVGGGVLIVPALLLLLHFEQKRATATSLIAVGPISIAGTIVYAVSGHIDWAVSCFLAIGMV
ncbi:MAG: sulfite exporter TauE/SafE family protein, partial [Microbacteriaceae bacterium]|nr:sulfite exporter TauE/SafE family protein [Microbacteriaceae bacterium]